MKFTIPCSQAHGLGRALSLAALLVAALLTTAPSARAQSPACSKVMAANRATMAQNARYKNTVTGAAVLSDVPKIHMNRQTWECTYLRDELFGGEQTAVYSEHLAGSAGTCDQQDWVSKQSGRLVREELDVTVPGKGKGHVSVRISYGAPGPAGKS